MKMRGLLVGLFGPTARAVCWSIDICLRAVPAAIYSWESSYVHE